MMKISALSLAQDIAIATAIELISSIAEIPWYVWLSLFVLTILAIFGLKFRRSIFTVLPSISIVVSTKDLLLLLFLIGTLFALAVLFAYGIAAHLSKPTFEWMHPTMNEADQEQAKTECEFESLMRWSAHMYYSHERNEHERLCLVRQGFEKMEVSG